MGLILDAGALVAIERRDRVVTALVMAERKQLRSAMTHGGVVGQVWRGGTAREALLARALPALRVVPLDEDLGRRAGELLARAGATDVIDAAVVLLATDGDTVLTSDVEDLTHLARVAEVDVDIIRV